MARVLVVEDDPTMGALVQRGLSEEGHSVTLVDNGVDALIAFANEPLDVAVVDVMLPQMSGFEVCRRIRESGGMLPIIVITARDAVEDRIFGLDAGADDYLTKPFHFGELSARIRAQLRRQTGSPQPVVQVGELRLDALAVRATVRGAPFALSVKEFTLLRDLATHLGLIRSRAEILEEVWGSAEHFEATIVDQYISYLRRKLEGADAGLRITTIRGAGYRLDPIDDVAGATS
ncbi:two-component system, OmpR family, response regulator [Plantibacter flavus]|uniref:Two-component system OmpR family response regulator n=1 Tax=Plantibacter flavus TaxID=150123 RepID=A0A3N2C778_9MICO|nr:response regulator transcription factor [Plantibacter flavus]ROR83327.1 two-component system OmpR family response regulator [Plantibacter flavus]SMG22558.1 two-component system, OmpR family, response regulator [Plantibacter flavus]